MKERKCLFPSCRSVIAWQERAKKHEEKIKYLEYEISELKEKIKYLKGNK